MPSAGGDAYIPGSRDREIQMHIGLLTGGLSVPLLPRRHIRGAAWYYGSRLARSCPCTAGHLKDIVTNPWLLADNC